MTETTGGSSEDDDALCPCGQETPRGEAICPECLTALRERDREADYENYPEFIEEADSIWKK